MTSNTKERHLIKEILKQMFMAMNSRFAVIDFGLLAAMNNGDKFKQLNSLVHKGFCVYENTGFNKYYRVYLTGATRSIFPMHEISNLMQLLKKPNEINNTLLDQLLKGFLKLIDKPLVKELQTTFEKEFHKKLEKHFK